jgi:hypothetical protein
VATTLMRLTTNMTAAAIRRTSLVQLLLTPVSSRDKIVHPIAAIAMT